MCLYDSRDPVGLLREWVAPAGGVCAGKACWKQRGERGYTYRDRTGSATGLRSLRLITSASGELKIRLKGHGLGLYLPPMPLDVPLTLQLQATNGECWEAEYSPAGVRRNSVKRFDATSD